MIDWAKIAPLVEIVAVEANRSRAERYIWFRAYEFARAYTPSEIPPNATMVLRFVPAPMEEAEVEPSETGPAEPEEAAEV